MENNKEYVLKETLELSGTHVCDITYKPKFALIIGFVFAILMFITLNWICIIFGVFVLVYVLIVTKTVDDYATMTIYDTYVLIHQLDHPEYVRKINYEDIEEWTYRKTDGNANCIYFKLKDGEIIYKDSFQATKAFNKLKSVTPSNEKMEIEKRKNREKQIPFSKALQNYIKKMKK